MNGVKAWFERLEGRERTAFLVFAALLTGVTLFALGIQVGQGLAHIV